MTTLPTETTAAAPPKPVVGESLNTALSSQPRPRRPGALSTSLTFGWRALLKIKHVPEQLLDVTMFPIMFTLIFTYLFGGALAGSPREYLQDLAPGILVMTVVWITMYTGMTLNRDIQTGVFDRFRSLPVWRPSPLVGALVGDAARYTMAGGLVIVLSVILGFRPDGGALGVILGLALVMLFSFSMSWVWTGFGLVLRTPESVMYGSMMVMFPLTFTSNVFVDPDTMPGWLQAVVDVNPVTHLVTATRGLMHGSVEVAELGWVFLACAALVVVFAPIALRLYNKER